jgi:phosphopantothenoylcysteine decarboxylase / phosphopantothenate---cysteine ligase
MQERNLALKGDNFQMEGSFKQRNMLVGIASSIHITSIFTYLRVFRKHISNNIKVIMTEHAVQMMNPETIELFVDDRVFIHAGDRSRDVNKAPHIQLSRWADLFVVVPATANIVGKAANGIADDLLSTTILSYPKPVIFVPVMNETMWKNKAFQRNILLLEQDGHYLVPSDSVGVEVGTGEWEQANVPSPPTVLSYLLNYLQNEQSGISVELSSEQTIKSEKEEPQDVSLLSSQTSSTPSSQGSRNRWGPWWCNGHEGD